MELRNSRKSELRQFQKCGVDTIPRRSKGKNADGREPGREESIAAYGPKGGHATADGARAAYNRPIGGGRPTRPVPVEWRSPRALGDMAGRAPTHATMDPN